MNEKKFLICVNERPSARVPSCARRGSRAIAEAIERGIRERGIGLELERIYCFGHCERGPNMRLAPGGRFWREVREEDVEDILDFLEGEAGRG
jgi:NADH:ubiquinone oxidoreductase subunit E